MQRIPKWGRLVVLLCCCTLAVVLPACNREGNTNHSVIGPTVPDSAAVAVKQPTNRVMPNYCFILNFPWMTQMPPKKSTDSDLTAWGLTHNCGQACAAMMGAYFNGGSTASWVIDQENDYLRFPKPYGYDTGTSTLPGLLRNFHALNSAVYHGYWADDVVQEGAHGHPVLVAVRIYMSSDPNARGHWMIFIGWDGYYMYFNDPGRSRISDNPNYDTWTAGHFRCTVDQFMASWNTQGRAYIPVWK